MYLDSKSTTACKMQKKSGVGPSQRSLRSSSARTVLVSKENKMENPKCTPRLRKESQRTCLRTSRHSDNGINSRAPGPPSVKIATVLGEIKNSKKVINVGKRSTRTALKIYDYCETDPDTENRPEGVSKKKFQTEEMVASKVERASNSKRKRSMKTKSTLPSKRKSVIDSSYFISGEEIKGGVKKRSSTPVTKIVKTEAKLKKKTVLAEVSTKISVKPNVNINKHSEAITKTVERKCRSLSENSSGDRSTRLAPGVLTNRKSLNDFPEPFCSTPVVPRVPAKSLDVRETVIRHSVSSNQCDDADKICEDVSEAFVNLSSVEKRQEVDCSIQLTKSNEEVVYAEIHHEPLHLGLTSTPEKNPSTENPHEHVSCIDSGMGDVVEVTLYDSPKKLSPIKAVASLDSSMLSDDSCYDDDAFESSLQRGDDVTPVRNDVEESVLKSFKAYHTPHQFRRHLFKKKSKNKKTLQKEKSKSPAEVKLDLWASVMNDHFEDIEGSDLIIE